MAKKSNNSNDKSKKALIHNKSKKNKTLVFNEKKNINAKKNGNSNREEGGGDEGGDDDWLTALVKVSSTTDSDSKLIANIKTKAERIEKRDAKKRRRDERKGNNKVPAIPRPSSNDDDIDVDVDSHPQSQKSNSQMIMTTNQQQRKETKVNLEKLKMDVKEVVKSIDKKSKVPYQDTAIKGKATAKSTISHSSQIQPRKNDYNGLGLVRPSLFLSLYDDSFIPKLEEEFAEHVEGFYGKQRTKAMKKQLDGNMLWRKLLKQKNNRNNNLSTKNNTNNSNNDNDKHNNNIRIDGKKLSDMTPDERVEAMIKAGMI